METKAYERLLEYIEERIALYTSILNNTSGTAEENVRSLLSELAHIREHAKEIESICIEQMAKEVM